LVGFRGSNLTSAFQCQKQSPQKADTLVHHLFKQLVWAKNPWNGSGPSCYYHFGFCCQMQSTLKCRKNQLGVPSVFHSVNDKTKMCEIQNQNWKLTTEKHLRQTEGRTQKVAISKCKQGRSKMARWWYQSI